MSGLWLPPPPRVEPVRCGNALGLATIGAPLRRGRSASQFVPTSIAGLQLWLKADAGTNQTVGGSPAVADGDPVGEWLDQSGSGNNASQATAGFRPTLKLAIQNALPVLRFDGSDDRIVATAFAVMPAKRGSIFVVYKRSATSYGALLSSFPAATVDFSLYASTTGTLYKWYDGAAATKNQAVADSQTLFAYAALIRDGDTTAKHRRNGALADSYTVTNNQQSADAITIGADTDGTEKHTGDIAEILVYDSALSGANLTNVEAYLASRWGL